MNFIFGMIFAYIKVVIRQIQEEEKKMLIIVVLVVVVGLANLKIQLG